MSGVNGAERNRPSVASSTPRGQQASGTRSSKVTELGGDRSAAANNRSTLALSHSGSRHGAFVGASEASAVEIRSVARFEWLDVLRPSDRKQHGVCEHGVIATQPDGWWLGRARWIRAEPCSLRSDAHPLARTRFELAVSPGWLDQLAHVVALRHVLFASDTYSLASPLIRIALCT